MAPRRSTCNGLFGECGLFTTRKLLFNFLGKARRVVGVYLTSPLAAGGEGLGEGALAFALDKLRADLAVDMTFDLGRGLGMCGNSEKCCLLLHANWQATVLMFRKLSE